MLLNQQTRVKALISHSLHSILTATLTHFHLSIVVHEQLFTKVSDLFSRNINLSKVSSCLEVRE